MNSRAHGILNINPEAKVKWIPIGDYQTEILQVDDFLANPCDLREFALNLAYGVLSPDDFYPGLRSSVSLSGGDEIMRWVSEMFLSRLFENSQRPRDVEYQGGTPCFFSVMTLDANNVPANFYEHHSDSFFWLATVLHLSDVNVPRGTAFWEHRPSGLQHWSRADPVMSARLEGALGLRLNDQLHGAFQRDVRLIDGSDIKHLFARKASRPPFSADEDVDWRLLEIVPAKFNRLIAYPSWQIHSAVEVPVEVPLTVDNMRLTMNQFVSFPFNRKAPLSPYPEDSYRAVSGLQLMRKR